MSELKDIFNSLEKKSSKWSGYFDVYERHLAKFVGKAPKILEIGVSTGGSLEMWQKYFGIDSTIIGLDIDPACLEYKYDGNVSVMLGDQGSDDFWNYFLTNNSEFDIVIDDGGHHMDQQVLTMFRLFPHLNNGGIFVMEDTHTSYWNAYGSFPQNPLSFLNRAKQLTDVLNQQHFEEPFIPQEFLSNFNDLYSVSFYNSMVVCEKNKTDGFHIVNN
jgi:hypothetical protein